LKQSEKLVKQLSECNQQLSQQVESLKAKVKQFAQMLFGKKSERNIPGQKKKKSADQSISAKENDKTKRKRGKQPGAKGFGRKKRKGLPIDVLEICLPEEETHCKICQRPYDDFGFEESEVIEWEVKLVKKVYRRQRRKRGCKCDASAGFITAPVVPKLIPKGLLSVNFWSELLLSKYLFQEPLHRIIQRLKLKQFEISSGTITEGLYKIGALVEPLYLRFLQRNVQSRHRYMDETRWMVFVEHEQKSNHRWWLWVSRAEDTCIYLLEPTRSAKVLEKLFDEEVETFLNCDRYSAYKTLGGKISLAFCWAHQRRDFIRVGKSRQKFQAWADKWVKRIGELYRLNDERLKHPFNSKKFTDADVRLRKQMEIFTKQQEKELANKTLHQAQRKILKSMKNHWKGLTLFVDYPELPMDNNESERRLRNPIVGRKNYYGSSSIKSGQIAAMLFSLFQTLLINKINPEKYLQAYLASCAQNGGQPPEDIEKYLPWKLTQEQQQNWEMPTERYDE